MLCFVIFDLTWRVVLVCAIGTLYSLVRCNKHSPIINAVPLSRPIVNFIFIRLKSMQMGMEIGREKWDS